MSDFEDAVHQYIDDNPDNVGRLAAEFQVAVIDILRWADGRSRPHPRQQRAVVAWIRGQVDGVG